MSGRRLAVSLPGRAVGELTQDRYGMVRWTPDASWEAEQEPKLGLDFLRQRGPRVHASDLPAWFENLLPEQGSELRSRLCALHGLREGQSYALIRAVGDDLVGAVSIRAATAGVDEVGDPSAPLRDTPSSFDGDRRPSALAGMQLKFSMSMVNERLVLAASAGRTQWIVKIAGREYDDLAAVEDTTMKWASEAGFDVPSSFCVPAAELMGLPEGWVPRDALAFAVRRFDRRDDGSRVHQEDFCQALGLRPRDKYGDKGTKVTYEGALRLATDACGEADGRELARRLGFIIASGNSDAHLKNWSLLWGDRPRPTLTPCYDLVATVSWPELLGWGRRDGPELALELGGTRRFRSLNDAALARCAAGSAPWVRDEIMNGITRARGAWSVARASAPERMSSALRRHWDEVPLLRDFGALE